MAERKLTKPELGHLKKAGDARKKTLKEFKLAKAAEMNVGDEVKVDVFAEGDRVDVTGISKGTATRRHQAPRRSPSEGDPRLRSCGPPRRLHGRQQRSFPHLQGKIGAGQMGNEQVTVLNLDVVKVDAELGILAVRGAIPGPKGGIVYLRNSVINVKEKGAAAGISSNPQKLPPASIPRSFRP